MSKSDWMVTDEGAEDYIEINFLSDEKCPNQIRIWARPTGGAGHRAEARIEIIREHEHDPS